MRYTTVQQSDWEGELKGEDIVKLKSSQEIRSYEDRQVGTKNETYTESERYQTGTKKECNNHRRDQFSGYKIDHSC